LYGKILFCWRHILYDELLFVWIIPVTVILYLPNKLLCCCNSDGQRSYVPAVGINPHNIRQRNQQTHSRHGASQIIAMYVCFEQQPYIKTETAENQCCHIDSVNSRYFFHFKGNSRRSEKENDWTETTLRQAVYICAFDLHTDLIYFTLNLLSVKYYFKSWSVHASYNSLRLQCSDTSAGQNTTHDTERLQI